MTSNDLGSNLLEDILKTGYPFEMEITSRMQKEDWKVLNGLYYIDKDEQKGREIDVIAQIHKSETFASKLTLQVGFSMIIEVKKSEDKPWVFFTSESSSFEKQTFPIRVVYSPFSLDPWVFKKG